MSKVQIIADSGCDLPLSFFTEHDVDLIPLKVHLEEKEYEDLVDIEPKVVFDAMRNGKVAKTSQIAPNTFHDVFTRYAEKNTPCIYIAFSSQLSGTYQTAVMIREQVLEEYPDFDLTIIDSKAASLGLGLIVHHASQLAKKGMGKENIIDEINFYCTHMEHLFTVDNLEYLRRGGRVSNVSAFIGGLLNIKPLLHVDNGKLVPIEKTRGRKKVFRRIIELMEERGVDLQNQLIGISHGDDEKTAQLVKQMIEEKFGCTNFLINTIGAVIGAHAGPGTIAVFFLNQKPNNENDRG